MREISDINLWVLFVLKRNARLTFSYLKEFPKVAPLLIAVLILNLPFTQLAYAEVLESNDYRIDGATIDGGGGIPTGTTDFSLFATVGDFSGNPRVSSGTYELRPGITNEFLANTPIVQCFETNSNGSSDCTEGPAYVNSYGMVRVCGSLGCYNRARFEIDTQGNPADTLYGVQISTDGFVTEIQQIDGISFRAKSASAKQLADYLSEEDWENELFNLKGLQSGTEYDLRITALHGDFTESSPSPIATATTSEATVQFDIDITDYNETTPETASPYAVTFSGGTELIAGGATQTSEELIWMDVVTNAYGGAAIAHRGLYGGLYSGGSIYTITSATANLNSTPEGFGLQNHDYSGIARYSEDYSSSGGGNVGSITISADYNNSGNNVGIINTPFSLLFGSDGPTDDGRVAMYVKARAGNSAPANTDYTEDIIIVIVGRY